MKNADPARFASFVDNAGDKSLVGISLADDRVREGLMHDMHVVGMEDGKPQSDHLVIAIAGLAHQFLELRTAPEGLMDMVEFEDASIGCV